MTANPSSSPPIVDPAEAIRDRCLSLSFILQKEIDPSALERLQQLDMDKAFRILDEVQGKHDLGNASAFIVSKVQKVFREEILEQWGKKLDHEDTQQFCELPQPRCFNKLVQRLCLMCAFVAVLGGIGAWFIGSTGTSSSETCAGTDAMECKAGAELLAEKNRTKQLEAENSQLKEQKESAGEKLFKILTQIGVDVNKQDEKGATPLHAASSEGHRDLAEMLLRNGAAVNQPTKKGATPLYVASENGFRDLAEILLRNGAKVNQPRNGGITPLYSAAQKGHCDLAEMLVRNGASVNQPGNDGNGPLHMAAWNGNIEVVKLLVKSGANIRATNQVGNTALQFASHQGHQEIVKLLQG